MRTAETPSVRRLALVLLVCAAFAGGALTTSLVGQSKKPTFDLNQVRDTSPADAAKFLLDGALQLAEDGSWERIAVGRAWYLGGDKTKGQQIFDLVLNGKKVARSDLFRIGRVYAEAGEWESASRMFERALALDRDDDSGMIEYGALANVHHDRARAEALFEQAMKKNPHEFWHWVSAGGSYLGVPPPQ